MDVAAAVCNAGGLGSVGTAVRTAALREQWVRLRELTDRPFAVNHTGRPFDEEVFDAILEATPAVVSFHMGVPADRIADAHQVGARWMQQVGDLRTAELALEAGADVLVAQGWEAGGNAGWVGTMVPVPHRRCSASRARPCRRRHRRRLRHRGRTRARRAKASSSAHASSPASRWASRSHGRSGSSPPTPRMR